MRNPCLTSLMVKCHVCVYMCVCRYICICISIYIYTQNCIYIYTYTYNTHAYCTMGVDSMELPPRPAMPPKPKESVARRLYSIDGSGIRYCSTLSRWPWAALLHFGPRPTKLSRGLGIWRREGEVSCNVGFSRMTGPRTSNKSQCRCNKLLLTIWFWLQAPQLKA